MTTLVHLCLVLTAVLGLASASPRPVWSRNLETGDKCRDTGANCGQDDQCCSSRCQLKCTIGPEGLCERRCAECKHRSEVCRKNGDCCSGSCAPNKFEPEKYTCTDEESWDHTQDVQATDEMDADTESLEDQGEMASSLSRSAAINPRLGSKKGCVGPGCCVLDGWACTRRGNECCSGYCKVSSKDPYRGYCKVPNCEGLKQKCNGHDLCCFGLTCNGGYCMQPMKRKAGEMHDAENAEDGAMVAMSRSGAKDEAEESPMMIDEDQGEMDSLSSESAAINPLLGSKQHKQGCVGEGCCILDGWPCSMQGGGQECCSDEGYCEHLKGDTGFCHVPNCRGLKQKCNRHDLCCFGLTCNGGYCMQPMKRKAGEMHDAENAEDGGMVAMSRSGAKDEAEESPIMTDEDDGVTGAPSAKETLGKLLKAVFKRLSSGKGIKMTVDVKNPEAVIDSLAK